MLMGAQYKEGRKKILAAFSKTVSPSFHVTLFASLRRVSRLSIKCRPCPLYLCVCVCVSVLMADKQVLPCYTRGLVHSK